MKKGILILTVLTAVLFVTAIYAQEAAKPAAPATPATPVAPAKAPVKKAVKKAAPAIVGEVVSVDATGNTITVKDKAGNSETLTLDAKATIKKAGKAISLSEISTGEKVTVRYRTEADKKIATSILVKVAPAVKAKKEVQPATTK